LEEAAAALRRSSATVTVVGVLAVADADTDLTPAVDAGRAIVNSSPAARTVAGEIVNDA